MACQCCACPNCDAAHGGYPTLTIAITSPGCPCTVTSGESVTCSPDFPAAGDVGWRGSISYCSSDGPVAFYCSGTLGSSYRKWFCTWGLTCTVEASHVTHSPFTLTFVFPAGACSPFCTSEITIVVTAP